MTRALFSTLGKSMVSKDLFPGIRVVRLFEVKLFARLHVSVYSILLYLLEPENILSLCF